MIYDRAFDVSKFPLCPTKNLINKFNSIETHNGVDNIFNIELFGCVNDNKTLNIENVITISR